MLSFQNKLADDFCAFVQSYSTVDERKLVPILLRR
jgi:hypothetical protein